MAAHTRSRTGRTGNQLLDKLPSADLHALADSFEPLDLPARQVLFRADDPLEHVYFPVSAVLSLIVPPRPTDDQGLEIATVGNEGLVGFTALLGVPTSFHHVGCHAPGDCLRLPVSVLMEAMARQPALDRMVKKYVAVAYRTVTQSVVCNALHAVEQRLCRWLLVIHARAAGEFPITQDLLASLLGVKRPTISVVANSLQKAGLISYRRGLVRVLDREKLEQSVCDCFKITKSVYEQILGK